MSKLDKSVRLAKQLDTKWCSIFNRLVDENGDPRMQISAMSRARIDHDLLHIMKLSMDLTFYNKLLYRAARDQSLRNKR